MKICPNGHLTKMASLYGKNHQKFLSSEPRDWWPWNLVYSIVYSSTTKFVQMMTLGWPWPFLGHGPICFPMLLHGWKLIQHIVMYILVCSAYPVHSGERYRTNGPLIYSYNRKCLNSISSQCALGTCKSSFERKPEDHPNYFKWQKTFQKCNPPDLKFYPSKLTD